MFAKIIIIIAMVLILVSLFSGLFFLVHDSGKTKRTVKALSVRIGISIALFLFLLLAVSFHFITPHPLG